jgi:hypothetical protein
MRRLLFLVAAIGICQVATPPATTAAENDRAKCEAYCLTGAFYCYLSMGIIAGRDKCDAQYEGCMAGCIAAIKEV